MSPAQIFGTHLSSVLQTGTAGADSQVNRAGTEGSAYGWRIHGATRRRHRSPGSLLAAKPRGGLSVPLPNSTKGGCSCGHEGVK